MEQVVLYAPDISCDHCIKTIKKVVGKLAGVEKVDAEVASKKVIVVFDPGRVPIATIEETMAEEGYPVAKGT